MLIAVNNHCTVHIINAKTVQQPLTCTVQNVEPFQDQIADFAVGTCGQCSKRATVLRRCAWLYKNLYFIVYNYFEVAPMYKCIHPQFRSDIRVVHGDCIPAGCFVNVLK